MAMTRKNIRVCEVLHDGTYYDVLVAVDNLDEVDDILQEWALDNSDIGEALDLPEALIYNKDITEVIKSLDIDNFAYVKSTTPVYMDIPRYAGVTGTFPTFPTTLTDGLFVMPACAARLYSLPNFLGTFGEFTIPSVGLAITEGLNYIGIRYNSGVPEYIKYTSDSSFDYSSIIPVAVVLSFSSVRYIIPYGQFGDGLPEKILSQNVDPVIKSGFTLDTDTNYVELSALSVRKGTKDMAMLAVDTSAVNNDMFLYSTNGATWTKSAVTTINNTQFQGAAGLETLGSGKVVVNQIYRLLDESAKMLFIVLSGSFDTAAEAIASDMIYDIPDVISDTAVLVGRAIVEKDSTSPVVQKVQKVSFGTV
jgi:hypothetical protein